MAQEPSRGETICNAALKLASPAGRAAFLDRECAGDAALRAKVEALLRANEMAGAGFPDAPTIMERPAATIAPPPSLDATVLVGETAAPMRAAPVTLPPENYAVGGEIVRGGMGASSRRRIASSGARWR